MPSPGVLYDQVSTAPESLLAGINAETQDLDLDDSTREALEAIKSRIVQGLYHSDYEVVKELRKLNLKALAQHVQLQDFNPRYNKPYTHPSTFVRYTAFRTSAGMDKSKLALNPRDS